MRYRRAAASARLPRPARVDHEVLEHEPAPPCACRLVQHPERQFHLVVGSTDAAACLKMGKHASFVDLSLQPLRIRGGLARVRTLDVRNALLLDHARMVRSVVRQSSVLSTYLV
jgi:hypothetical protein